jgi:hypothetical protein
LKAKRCEIKFSKSKGEIEGLRNLHSNGYIDLYFGDASHFSTVPNVPYAWQTKDNPVLLPSARSKSLSVFGLVTTDCKLYQETFEGSINSEKMVGIFDRFSQTIVKKTIVVLDNAPIHKSKLYAYPHF